MNYSAACGSQAPAGFPCSSTTPPSGVFALRADSVAIARGLVALEDGLGLQVHPGIDGSAAERILLEWAADAGGRHLASRTFATHDAVNVHLGLGGREFA
jgi:hypothetical protein